MNRRKQSVQLLFVIFLLYFTIYINMQLLAETYGKQINEKVILYQDFGVNSSITINGDADFAKYKLPGNGSIHNPFLIKDLFIETTNISGIYISSTTKNFIIQNCYVEAKEYGIFLMNIAVGTAQIINNTCNNNSVAGIYLFDSKSSLIANNEFLLNKKEGLYCRYSGLSKIINNTFYDCGLFVFEETILDFLSYEINGNSVNKLPLGYIINMDSITINYPYGQLIIINCTNLTVEQQYINNTSIGMMIFFSTNCQVLNSTFSNNNLYGTYILSSKTIKIENCTYSNNFYNGIQVVLTELATIKNCDCNNNTVGIYIYDSPYTLISCNSFSNNLIAGLYSIYFSDYSTFSNNSFCNDGLYIFGETIESYLSYVIENNTINDRKLIYLKNTNNKTLKDSFGQIFLINCSKIVIENNNCSFTSTGITLKYSSNCQIVGNNCSNNTLYGIKIDNADSTRANSNFCLNNLLDGFLILSSPNSTFSNNTLANNQKNGMSMSSSEYSKIEGNVYRGNGKNGFYASYSEKIIVENNLCINNIASGIYIVISSSSKADNNSCSHNGMFGMHMRSSGGSIVQNNSFFLNGFFISNEYSIDSYLSYTVQNNTVNNLPLGYLYNLNNTRIEKLYGQLFLINCEGVTVANQNYSSTSVGLTLAYSSNCQIESNVISNNNKYGIYIYESTNLFVSNNYLFNNNIGIWLLSGPSSTIVNNTCVNSGEYGFFLSSSEGLIVANNSISNNSKTGIELLSCSASNIENNNFAKNAVGLSVKSNFVFISENNYKENELGLYVSSSKRTIIDSNIFIKNSDSIQLISSDNCTIIHNILLKGNSYALTLDMCSDNNTIYHNIFIANTKFGTSQAYDDGVNNTWYNITLLEGNYWSDWSGVGNYSIDGIARNVDPYPSHLPYTFNIDSTNRKLYLLILLAIPIAVLPIVYFSYKKRKFWFFK